MDNLGSAPPHHFRDNGSSQLEQKLKASDSESSPSSTDLDNDPNELSTEPNELSTETKVAIVVIALFLGAGLGVGLGLGGILGVAGAIGVGVGTSAVTGGVGTLAAYKITCNQTNPQTEQKTKVISKIVLKNEGDEDVKPKPSLLAEILDTLQGMLKKDNNDKGKDLVKIIKNLNNSDLVFNYNDDIVKLDLRLVFKCINNLLPPGDNNNLQIIKDLIIGKVKGCSNEQSEDLYNSIFPFQKKLLPNSGDGSNDADVKPFNSTPSDGASSGNDVSNGSHREKDEKIAHSAHGSNNADSSNNTVVKTFAETINELPKVEEIDNEVLPSDDIPGKLDDLP